MPKSVLSRAVNYSDPDGKAERKAGDFSLCTYRVSKKIKNKNRVRKGFELLYKVRNKESGLYALEF